MTKRLSHTTVAAALALLLTATACQASLSASAEVGDSSKDDPAPAAPAKETATPSMAESLESAQTGSHRSAEESARDVYRHPVETLEFFGLKPTMKVIELEPGDGWYAALLAPALRDRGSLLLASAPAEASGGVGQDATLLAERLAAHPEIYDRVVVLPNQGKGQYDLGEPNSADLIVSFRNNHFWKAAGVEDEVYQAAFDALKPGGHLGLVQHRAFPGSYAHLTVKQGYLPQAYVIERVMAAGFEFVAESEINANTKDVKDYPRGVWTLPPTLALGEQDRERYLAIGESDRMTLLFRKPAIAASADLAGAESGATSGAPESPKLD